MSKNKYIREMQYWKFLLGSGGVSRLYDYLKENVWFDLKHGVNTAGWLEPQDFEGDISNLNHGVRYRASYTSEVMTRLQQASKLMEFKDVNFYDLGCGKGKVLLIAAKYFGFRKVVGIDYYKEFLEVANKNAQKINVNNITLLNENAENFCDFSEHAVIYMYNPFDDFIMERVRKNIERKCKRAVIVYNKPLHQHVFCDWFVAEKKVGANPDWSTSILLYARADDKKSDGQMADPVQNPYPGRNNLGLPAAA